MWVRSVGHGWSEYEETANSERAPAPTGDREPLLLELPERRFSAAPPSTGRTSRRVVAVPGRTPTMQTPAGMSTATAGAPGPTVLEVLGTEFRFIDLPEPGAHAVLSVTVRSLAESPSSPLVLSVPSAWFERFTMVGAIPAVLDDRPRGDGFRQFEFPGAAPHEEATFEIHVIAASEDVSAPPIRLAQQTGDLPGEIQPQVAGAAPRPGRVRALSLPRLDIRTQVVDTAWEPPSYVAGQLTRTANLGDGNSVLIGHLRGLAGSVFSRLKSARLGTKVWPRQGESVSATS